MSRPSSSPDQRRRWVRLDGTDNFRDLGGYRGSNGRVLRWGAVYRSAKLDALTDAGMRRLGQLGIRTVIDLRRPDEAPSGTEDRFAQAGLVYRNVSLSPPEATPGGPVPNDLGQLMVERLAGARPGIARVVRMLAGEVALPAVCFCGLGRDRTGLLVAFVLSLLGVDDEAIVTDYAATPNGLPPLAARAFPDGRVPRPEHMAAVLAEVRSRYGGPAEALVPYGLDADVVAALQRRLTA